MSTEIAAGVMAQLATTNLNGGAHDTRPSAAVYPYVVAYIDDGIRSSDREADVRIRRTVTFQTTTVGTSQAQCRAARTRVLDALEDAALVIAGWSCSKTEHPGTQPVKADEELPDRVVFYATDQWSFVADPA